jgi:N-acetylglucosamine-6-sulfatase
MTSASKGVTMPSPVSETPGVKRSDFLKAAGTSLLSLPLFGLSGGPARAQEATTTNIVAICTDDQTAASVWAMPTVMTQLAAKGVRVLPAFAATPICGPARGTLLSGRWSHNTGVTVTNGAYPSMKATHMEDDTFATRLQEVGYTTGFFGKYNNDYDERRVPPGWDRWFAFREPLNRADWYEFNSDGTTRRFNRAARNETDVIAERVVDFVRSRQAGQPWLAYICPHDPHGPYFPADRHKDEFQGATWDPASEGEADLSDKPALVRKEPTYSQSEEAQNEEEYRGKLRELLAVDDLVREVLRALEETGQLANTYVLFFTDNGYLFGEHRLQKKNLPYDEACRVPFLARGPGVVSEGFMSNALVSQLDVAPTLCAIGGATTQGMDGRSLLPILAGEKPEWWRRCLMIEDVEKGWYSLRTPTHWYTEWDTGEKELYDLVADPNQMRSIHGSADPALLAALSETLDTLKSCSGRSCRRADGDLDTLVP